MADTTISGTEVTDVTLQGDGKAFIRENPVRKESNLIVLPLYLQDSDETDVLDYNGVVKTITLNGIYIGDNEAEAKTFVDNCEALQNGAQDTSHGYPLTFTDDRRGTVKVKVMSYESVFVEGFPTGVTWTMVLVESSENA